jgi:hypothetical protein
MRIVHIHDGLEDSQAALVGRVRRHLVRVAWRDCLAGRDMDPPPADLALVETDVVDLAAVSPLLSGKVPALLATSPPEAEPRAAGAMARGLKRAKLGFGLLATPSFHPGLAGLFGLAQSGVLGRVVEISLRRAGPWKPFLLGGPHGKGEGGGNWWDRQVLRACLGMDTGGGDGGNGSAIQVHPLAAGDSHRVELELLGTAGHAHYHETARSAACVCELRTRFPLARGREWHFIFDEGVPLACELAWNLRFPPAVPTHSGMARVLGEGGGR